MRYTAKKDILPLSALEFVQRWIATVFGADTLAKDRRLFFHQKHLRKSLCVWYLIRRLIKSLKCFRITSRLLHLRVFVLKFVRTTVVSRLLHQQTAKHTLQHQMPWRRPMAKSQFQQEVADLFLLLRCSNLN